MKTFDVTHLFHSGHQLHQQPITNYAQKTSRPPPIPPVTKAGIQEHFLAIVATCDLVSVNFRLTQVHLQPFVALSFR